MLFRAKYIKVNKHLTGKPIYYKSIYADSVNEGAKIAERYTRKGYFYVSLEQVDV